MTLGHVGIPDCDVGSLVISLAGDEENYCNLTPDDPMYIGHALGEVVVTYTTISRTAEPGAGFSVGFVSAFGESWIRYMLLLHKHTRTQLEKTLSELKSDYERVVCHLKFKCSIT